MAREPLTPPDRALPGGLLLDQLAGSGAVRELEQKFAQYYGKRHALAVTNATLALYAISEAIALRGREVITTPLSWGGTVAGPLAAGARIVFSDVDSRTLALAADGLAEGRSRAAAILAVDYLGVPADDEALRHVADGNGWWYVHDAAQSLGARINGRAAGSMAHVIVASLSAGKALCAGEGGVIITDDSNLYEKLIWITQHPDRQKRDLGLGTTNEFALNIRINPLAAWWAAARFEIAIEQAEERSARWRRLVRALDRSGLSVPLRYEDMGLSPSFFRVTASWSGEAQLGCLARWLVNESHHGVQARPAALLPLYEKLRRIGSNAQYATAPCPTAEREADLRFELSEPHVGECQGVMAADVSLVRPPLTP